MKEIQFGYSRIMRGSQFADYAYQFRNQLWQSGHNLDDPKANPRSNLDAEGCLLTKGTGYTYCPRSGVYWIFATKIIEPLGGVWK